MNILQLGCNDGMDHVLDFISNNYQQINYALLVDAVSENIEIAKKTYQKYDRVKFLHSAVSNSRESTISFYHRGLITCQAASIRKSHVLGHASNVEEIVVPNTEINSLITSYPQKEIDILYCDIEGMDCEILLNLDFSIKPIKKIFYECCHCESTYVSGESNEETIKKLLSKGYKISKPEAGTIQADYECNSL